MKAGLAELEHWIYEAGDEVLSLLSQSLQPSSDIE